MKFNVIYIFINHFETIYRSVEQKGKKTAKKIIIVNRFATVRILLNGYSERTAKKNEFFINFSF